MLVYVLLIAAAVSLVVCTVVYDRVIRGASASVFTHVICLSSILVQALWVGSPFLAHYAGGETEVRLVARFVFGPYGQLAVVAAIALFATQVMLTLGARRLQRRRR